MTENTSNKRCVYCDEPIGKIGQGEHIVPKAIGGGKTLKTVCQRCNNQFSQLDEHLCSRSLLGIIASQELDRGMMKSWDIIRSETNLIVEAEPDWENSGMRHFPQIILDNGKLMIYGSTEETFEIGASAFCHTIKRAAMKSVRRYVRNEERKGKTLAFERINLDNFSDFPARYPPRIFTRLRIKELAQRNKEDKGASFTIRFLNKPDANQLIRRIRDWITLPDQPKSERVIGSCRPPFSVDYDIRIVCRALSKIAVNLIAFVCRETPINQSDPYIRLFTQIIKGELTFPNQMLRCVGFVHTSNIASISKPGPYHSFRIAYADGKWHIFCSFFGGRIGAFVRFKGPHQGKWCNVDILAPIGSSKWTVNYSSLLLPMSVTLDWTNTQLILDPSSPTIFRRQVRY